jgi:hypothetical protein
MALDAMGMMARLMAQAGGSGLLVGAGGDKALGVCSRRVLPRRTRWLVWRETHLVKKMPASLTKQSST